MKIGIDARFYGPIGKGLGRYTQKLIENLEKFDNENSYFIFLKKENFDEYVPKKPNFKKVLADFRWYTFSEQIKFPILIRKYNLDLMHFPHFNVPILYSGKFIVTIHDLILLHFPTIRSSTLSPFVFKIKFLAYRIVIRLAISRSEKIIAVSNFTKNDILKNYSDINSEKIEVTYEACEDFCMLSPNKDEEIISKYGIRKPYIMYVGNAYPHKNLEKLILVFKNIKKTKNNLQLVFVGKEDFFYKRLKKFSQDLKVEDIVFLGYVPDYELDTLFYNVAVFVWPTLYEGFGLPPLEAMAKGSPVASSDHACMKEVLGDSAHYFDGKNSLDMEKAILGILNDENLRNKLVKKGYERILKYSWKEMAKKTLFLYKKIIENEK